MESWLFLIGGAGLAYAIGSLSFATVICRLLRLPDPRIQGSGNPGATNVLRIGGKKAGLLTFLGDLLKGSLAVWSMLWVEPQPFWVSAAFLAVVLGHIYPLFFRFRGGKGVAPFLGGVLALSLPLGLLFIGIWASVFYLTRYSSLSSLLAVLGMPLLADLFSAPPYKGVLWVLTALIVWRHRDNIRRLFRGQEKSFR